MAACLPTPQQGTIEGLSCFHSVNLQLADYHGLVQLCHKTHQEVSTVYGAQSFAAAAAAAAETSVVGVGLHCEKFLQQPCPETVADFAAADAAVDVAADDDDNVHAAADVDDDPVAAAFPVHAAAHASAAAAAEGGQGAAEGHPARRSPAGESCCGQPVPESLQS